MATYLGLRGSPTLLLAGERFDGIEGLRQAARRLGDPNSRNQLFNPLPGESQPRKPSPAASGGRDAESCTEDSPFVAASSDPRELPAGGKTVTHDFGSVARGTVVNHEFEITNEGSAPLRLTQAVMPPTVELRGIPDTIPPGATARCVSSCSTTPPASSTSRKARPISRCRATRTAARSVS